MKTKTAMINAAMLNYGIKAFNLGALKAYKDTCKKEKDHLYYEEQYVIAENEYVKAQDHLKELLGMK